MKKLQNNFTTQEQSERLLKIGVPADSADFFYDLEANNPPHANQVPWFLDVTYSKLSDEFRLRAFLPCWSVGRLIEIWEVVTEEKWLHETEQPIIEELISNFNYYSYDNDDPLDFSKLED